MLDQKTRATKLMEAFGWSTRASRWVAERDKRSALGHVWVGSALLNIPYYIVFVFSLLLYMGGGLDLSQAMLLLIIPLALYSYGTRQLVINEFFWMMDGIANDLDNLEQRIEKIEALREKETRD
jgi:hypothetical protein